MGLPGPKGKIATPERLSFLMEDRMNRWTQDVRSVLERAPTGALPLSTIAEELRREDVFLNPKDPCLLSNLMEEREMFRVISVPGGPWTNGAENQWVGDSWIVLKKPTQQGFGRGEGARCRIQAGVQAWAQEMDDSSPASVARWIRANLEGSLICRALVTG